jgi:hypothetical protein
MHTPSTHAPEAITSSIRYLMVSAYVDIVCGQNQRLKGVSMSNVRCGCQRDVVGPSGR